MGIISYLYTELSRSLFYARTKRINEVRSFLNRYLSAIIILQLAYFQFQRRYSMSGKVRC